MVLNYKGKWFALEGPDFSGTSTQIHLLAKRIFDADKSHMVLVTREPTMRKYGAIIRKKQLDPSTDLTKTGRELLELYAADRIDHIKNVIVPALKQGIVVLSDRCVYSTLVYQGIQGMSSEDVWDAHYPVKHLAPDISLVFDVDLRSIKSRMNPDGSHQEVWDKLEWQEKAIEGYSRIDELVRPSGTPQHIVRIDATASIEEVTDECWTVIRPELPMVYTKLKTQYKK